VDAVVLGGFVWSFGFVYKGDGNRGLIAYYMLYQIVDQEISRQRIYPTFITSATSVAMLQA
jgi:hypothetical protein